MGYQQKLRTEQDACSDLVRDSLSALVKVSQRVLQVASSPGLQKAELEVTEMVDLIKGTYKRIKKNFTNYMRSHILLMDENMSYPNLFKLLKEFLFHLVGCEQFSFCIERDGKLDIYQSQTDAFQTDTLTVPLHLKPSPTFERSSTYSTASRRSIRTPSTPSSAR